MLLRRSRKLSRLLCLLPERLRLSQTLRLLYLLRWHDLHHRLRTRHHRLRTLDLLLRDTSLPRLSKGLWSTRLQARLHAKYRCRLLYAMLLRRLERPDLGLHRSSCKVVLSSSGLHDPRTQLLRLLLIRHTSLLRRQRYGLRRRHPQHQSDALLLLGLLLRRR